MTKVMIQIRDDGHIFFDIANHADDKYVCCMASTVCNMLLVACDRAEITSITDADAHKRIEIDKASPALVEIFKVARDVFGEIESQFPDNLRMY